MAIARVVLSVIGASLATLASAATLSVVALPTRGVQIAIGYVGPDAPIATLIVLPGGDGRTNVSQVDSLSDALAQRGIAVINVDAPSDQATLTTGFRQSAQHAADIQAVMTYAQARSDVPVWLGGISAGTISVAHLGINLPATLPFGVVFASTVTEGGDSVLNLNLESLRRPAFLLAHAQDTCSVTPPDNTPVLQSRLTGAPATDVQILSGGPDTGAAGCGPGHHIFDGQSDDVAAAIAGFVTKYNALVPPDLDQHGLTGLWYEPVTSGQGFALEVFPDVNAQGSGLVAGGWFTFDATAGGADKQRWYTLSGAMHTRTPRANVTIYQNVGGNFDAAPVTTAQVVGNGTLVFPTCDAARLAYAFADGRAGAIPLTRLTSNVECTATTQRTANADFGLSGNWFDARTSGQGLIVEANPATRLMFFTWYTYAPQGQDSGAAGQRWYTGQGAYAPGARSASVTLYQTTGGAFDTAAPAAQTTAVGTGVLSFASCAKASLDYAFAAGTNAGRAGTIALTRVGPAPSSCAF